MNSFIVILLVTTTVSAINENNSDATTKNKRTIPDFQNQAELKQLTPIYQVNHPNNQPAYQQTYHQSNEPHLNNFYENSNKYYTQSSTPIKTVFEGDSKIPAVKNIFEDTPKVAAQHVLYEYEQTPTNAVSNVQVKQLFQRPEESKTVQTEKIALPEPNRFLSAETAVNPVHHSTLVNHAQNFGHVVNHPLYNVQPTHVQHQQYIPNKYFYVNGKIVYQPGQQNQHPTANVNNHQTQVPRTNFQNYQTHPQTHHNPVHSQPYSVSNQNFVHGQSTPYLHNKQYQKIPPSNVPQQYRSPQQKLIPPPMTYVRFHPPARHQMQPITQPVATPIAAPVKEEQAEEEEEEDDKEQLREEEEDSGEANEEEESANLEEADGEAEEEEDDREYQRPEKLHGKYSFDEDEERDHDRYKEHESDDEEDGDDRDSNRGSSKYVTSKTKKPYRKVPKNGKYDKKDNYSYSEGYSTSTKYESPKSKNGKGKPKKHYKKVKYSTNSNSKPKYEVIEGKQSQHIPVTHKQKFVKEKFYLSRSFNDGFERAKMN